MHLVQDDGGTSYFKKFQTDAAIAAGVPSMLSAAADGGIIPVTTTAAATFLGLVQDGQTDGTSAGVVTTCITPGQVMRAKLSGSATDDVALTIATAGASGSTTLINNITGLDPTTPDIDDGMVWFFDGINKASNAREYRQIIAVATAPDSITVQNLFRAATVSGDTFLYAATVPGSGVAGVTLTTSLQQVVQDVDNDTMNFVCVGADLGTEDNNGDTNSALLLQSGSRTFGF